MNERIPSHARCHHGVMVSRRRFFSDAQRPIFFPHSGSIGTGVPVCSTGCVKRYFHTSSWMNFPLASLPAALPGTTELCARRASPFTSNVVIKRRELPYGGALVSTFTIAPNLWSPSICQDRQ